MSGPERAAERELLSTHPHGRVLLGPLALLPVLTGVAAFLGVALPDGRTGTVLRWAVVVLAGTAALRWCCWPLLRWRASTLTVTTQRVSLRTGVLRRRWVDMPLDRIEEVSVQRGVLDRLVRSGTLIVRAGAEGRLECRSVANPRRVQQLLAAARGDREPPA